MERLRAEFDDDQEDTTRWISGARLGTAKSLAQEDFSDPFMSEGDDLLKMDGMSVGLRRKIGRQIQKAAGVSNYTTAGGSFNGMPSVPTPAANMPEGKDGARSKKLEPVEVTAYAMFSVVQPTYNMDYLTKIYEINASHYAACNAKVSNVIGLGYEFINSDATNEKIDEIPDGDEEKVQKMRRKIEKFRRQFHEKIDSMNDTESLLETLKRAYLDYEVTGNAYLEIGRTNTGEIGYIGHVPASTVRVRRRRDGFVQIVNYRAMFFRNYGDTETPDQVGSDQSPNEIIHFKKYTPTNVYYGIPDIIPSVNAVAGDQFASKFNLDYFENKAVPRYIITVKGAKLNPDSERKLLEFFQTGLKGSNHRTLYIPLPADEGTSKVEFKMDPVEADVQDSSFHQYRMDNKLEILMAHRVPITKVSVMEGISLANARDMDKTFREQVTKPAQSDFENKLNKIIRELTDVFKLKFNELTLTDADTQSKIDERYLRTKVYVPNDVRIRDGLIPLDGGDSPVQLTGQQAADMTARTTGNRNRDQQRSAGSSDSSGESRNPKGDGRQAN